MSAPPRIAYLNGQFLPLAEARIPIMDRGFLFGDGIYEVTAVVNGRLIDNAPHLARLDRSLREIGIANPHDLAGWTAIQTELVALNRFREGLIYIEVTRGVAERDFLSPDDLAPTVVMVTQDKAILDNPAADRGIGIITLADQRWARRDIKSVSLLAQVLAKRAARDAGVAEAWMVEDGYVTEGASSTAFIVTPGREIVTRPLSHAVLPGITRETILRVAREHGYTLVERPFTVVEALGAAEAFITSASTIAMPVITIDGQPVGDGRPGPVVKALRAYYFEAVLA